jgi:thiamine biosynthesis lipoprotein
VDVHQQTRRANQSSAPTRSCWPQARHSIGETGLIDAAPQMSLLAGLSYPTAYASAADRAFSFHDDGVLGTRFDMRVEAPNHTAALGAALAARNEADRLVGVLSWRHSHSELARLNRTRELVASDALIEVLQAAARWRECSNGAFDERIGKLSRLWRQAVPQAPDAAALEAAVRAVNDARIEIDAAGRRVWLGHGVELDLDGIAKGWIVDAAVMAARRAAPEASAILLSIGGDAACWSNHSTGRSWLVGLPQAGVRFDNAPLDAVVELSDGAIASSGFGRRDLRCGSIVNCRTLAASDGRPVAHSLLATAIASKACDADALATVALVMPAAAAIEIANASAGCAVRIAGADGSVATSARWPILPGRHLQPVRFDKPQPEPQRQSSAQQNGGLWPLDWRMELWWTAPKREERGPDFRAPYMALWVADASGTPVRTIAMVGRDARWQKENYIWWGNYRARAEKLIDIRSEATAPSGRYALIWDGRDDDGHRVPAGRYALHLETSREKGRHVHRTLDIDIGDARFKAAMESLPESGGFKIYFGSPNDDYDPE